MKSFLQTIQEESINDKLDKLGHSVKLSSKKLAMLKGDSSEFEYFDLEDWFQFPFPKNSSEKTKKEIQHLISLGQFRTTWEEEMILYDIKVIQPFKEYLSKHNIEDIDWDRIKRKKDHSVPIILSLKRHYNRPRPKELAKELGLPLDNFPLKTAGSPSYPSGHATQGTLISLLVADEAPLEYRKDILDIGKRIGESRQIAGAHYPTDTAFGVRLAKALYNYSKSSMEPDLKLESILKEEEEVQMTIDDYLPPSNENTARTAIFEGAALWGMVGSNIISESEWKNAPMGKKGKAVKYNDLSITTMGQWYQEAYLDIGGDPDIWNNFCNKLGGHITNLDGVSSSSKFIWDSIEDYYAAAPKTWQVPVAGKKNTADCVIITKGTPKTLISKLKELKKLSEEEQVKRTVSDGSKITLDGEIIFYQVSLKKDAAPGEARAGKWTQLAGKDLDRTGMPGKLRTVAAAQQTIGEIINPTFTYDPSEFLEEGMFGNLIDKIKDKVGGFVKKVKTVFKKIVKFITSKAKKLTDAIIKKDKKVKAAQGLVKEMASLKMPLKEEMLNEFIFRAARKGKPLVYNNNLYGHVQDFKDSLGEIERTFKQIQTNVDLLNKSKVRKFNPIIYNEGKEALQMADDLKQLDKLFKLPKPEKGDEITLDSELYSMFWVVLNVTSNWIGYVYLNNILKQVKEKMDSYENLEYGLSDAVLSMSGDVSAEAKFGNTALPLVIVKGGGVIDHLGKRDNYSADVATKLKREEVYEANWPIMEIKINRVGKTGALHNAITIFLLENIEIDGKNVTPIYGSSGFNSKSGSKFSTAVEVNTQRKGYKG